jgi:hypothetical protein
MIEEQTVLVLGAGASRDLGFPTGEKLLQDIYSFALKPSMGFTMDAKRGTLEVANSKLLARLLELAVGLGLANEQDETNESFVKKFAEELFNARPRSIDEFLSDRPVYSLIGRICIVFCISRYEDKNSKYFVPTMPERNVDSIFPDFGWYEYLWHKMTENVDSIEEFKKNKVTVITFNYDRSLEFYLFRALQSKFGKPDAEIADVFAEIEIKHVYGKLAPFYWEHNYLIQNSNMSGKDLAMECTDFSPWEPSVLFRLWGNVGSHGMDKRDFDSKRTVLTEVARSEIVNRFIKAANDIKIYSEVLEEHKNREYLEDLMKAKRIYFLGFGYHEQNLLALGLTNGVLSEDTQILGTAYNMTDGEMQDKKNRITKSIGWKLRGNRGQSNNVVRLANLCEITNHKEASVIKEFFRTYKNADLV